MPEIEATERDLVEEVEELLKDCPEVADAAYNIEHALFADSIERQRNSPFWGESKKIARVYARSPELLRRLVEEVKRLALTEQEVKLLTDYHYYEAEKAITRRGDKAQQQIHLERLAALRNRDHHA